MFNQAMTPPILFPRRKRFDQLFEFSTTRQDLRPAHIKLEGKNFGPYCRVRLPKTYKTLWVRPRADVLKVLGGRMVSIDNDEITFEVVYQKDGSALVTAQYNKILGSHWLAYVDGKSVPLRRELRPK